MWKKGTGNKIMYRRIRSLRRLWETWNSGWKVKGFDVLVILGITKPMQYQNKGASNIGNTGNA